MILGFRSLKPVLVSLAALFVIRGSLYGFENKPGDFLVQVWQTGEGLPSNGVRSIVQAADGWLWIATSEGVVRFDGSQFFGFESEPDATFSHVPARALFAMPNGDVWINTTRGGLLHWHEGRLLLVWADDDPSLPKPTKPSVDQVISDGYTGAIILCGSEMWVAENDATPVRQDPPGAAKKRALIESWRASHSDSLVDSQGRKWRVNGYAVTTTDTTGKTSNITLPGVDEATQIGALYEDREGNIWVPTGGSGLMRIHPRLITVLSVNEGLFNRAARSVIEDRSGRLWVSMRGGGLDRVDENIITHFDVDKKRSGREIVALCEDKSSNIWAATNLGQVLFIDDQGIHNPPFGASPGPTKVNAISVDGQGRMWFADAQGLAIWDGSNVVRIPVPAQIFYTLAVDKRGTVWAGSKTGAVFRSKGLVMELLGTIRASRGISSLLPDEEDSLWVTTIGGGLFHFKNGHWFGFTAEHGLPDSRLTWALDDASGNLWLGSLKGILAVSKMELTDVEKNINKTAHWREFDRDDGLLARECTGGTQPAGWHLRDGRLIFATANGVAQVNPKSLPINRIPPVPSIKLVLVNGRPAKLTNGFFKAGPGRIRLEFKYVGITFTASEKTQFRARLDGLDKTWQEVGNERSLVYDSIPPGHYRFRLLAANRDGFWSKESDSVAFEVLPFFWERASFRVGMGLLAVFMATGSSWIISRSRMKRRLVRIEDQNAREKERARIARDLHDDLGASLTEISLLAGIAAESNGTKTSENNEFSNIASKAQSLVSTLDEIVWAVNPRHDTLASLAEYLAAFASDLFSAAGIRLRVDIPREFPRTTLDAERRYSIFLAAREALNNAAKYSRATEVHLRIHILEDRLEIMVEDNGRGFDPGIENGGNGLINLRERLTRMGGSCSIVSSQSNGAKVFLRLPL